MATGFDPNYDYSKGGSAKPSGGISFAGQGFDPNARPPTAAPPPDPSKSQLFSQLNQVGQGMVNAFNIAKNFGGQVVNNVKNAVEAPFKLGQQNATIDKANQQRQSLSQQFKAGKINQQQLNQGLSANNKLLNQNSQSIQRSRNAVNSIEDPLKSFVNDTLVHPAKEAIGTATDMAKAVYQQKNADVLRNATNNALQSLKQMHSSGKINDQQYDTGLQKANQAFQQSNKQLSRNSIIKRDPVKAAADVATTFLNVATAGGDQLVTGLLRKAVQKGVADHIASIGLEQFGKNVAEAGTAQAAKAASRTIPDKLVSGIGKTIKGGAKGATIVGGYGGLQAASDKGTKTTGADVLQGVKNGIALGAGLGAGGSLIANIFKAGSGAILSKLKGAKDSSTLTEDVKPLLSDNGQKLLGSGEIQNKLGSSNQKQLGTGIKGVGNQTETVVGAKPATAEKLPVSDQEYHTRFNALNDSYDKATKQLEQTKSPLKQQALQDRIEQDHLEQLHQLNDEYVHGKSNPDYQAVSEGKKVKTGFTIQQPQQKTNALGRAALGNHIINLDKQIHDIQVNGTSKSADELRGMMKDKEIISNVKSGKMSSNDALDQVKYAPARKTLRGMAIKSTLSSSEVKTISTSKLTSYEGAPDKAKVEAYKQQIQSGKTLEPLIVKKDSSGNLGIEDGKHRLEAYKQLGIDKVPVIDKTTPSKVSQETTQSKPNTAPGKIATNKLATGVEKKAIEHKLTDSLGDLPQHAKVNMKEQAQFATDLLAKDEQKALDIATGKAEPPSHILPESVYVAVENKALREGNVDILRQLASSTRTGEASVMGQRIRTLGERNQDSPVTMMRQVSEARVKAVETKTGQSVSKNVNKMAKQIDKTIKRPTRQDWASFVNDLRCT